MSDYVYWDNFAERYVIDKDTIAPPERYIIIYCNDNSIYTETWSIGNSKQLSVAYTADDLIKKRADRIRNSVANQHNVSLLYMIRLGIPKKYFNKILEGLFNL